MMKFADYHLRGIDVSQFNLVNPTIVPDMRKLHDLGGQFIIIRSSYGQVMDKAYLAFKTASKGLLDIGLYHYMDYYSQSNIGLTSSQWGIRQAEFLWGLNKNDNYPVFIDVESASPTYAPNISLVWPTAMTVLDNLLTRYDQLSGKTAGLYASTGWLSKFYSYQKSRPLFAANYNPHTLQSIRDIVAQSGFTNLVAWQYASDGDIDDNGTGDGKLLGIDYAPCDLDIWMRDEAHYRAFFGVTSTPIPEPVPTPINQRLVDVKSVQVASLNMRSGAGVNYPIIKPLAKGTVVECLEYKDVTGNLWARVGQGQWCCVKGGTVTYLS